MENAHWKYEGRKVRSSYGSLGVDSAFRRKERRMGIWYCYPHCYKRRREGIIGKGSRTFQ